MKLLTKLTLVFSLVCYLAVSSIAAAHAFSSLDSRMGIKSDSAEIMPDCHQEGLSSVDSVHDEELNTVSPCKIFCSAMANIVPTEFGSIFSFIKPTVAVTFLSENLLSRQLAVEPHPPK